MTITLQELREEHDALTSEVRGRARVVGLGGGYTKRYAVLDDRIEVGFVALDFYPIEPLWLHDIYVLQNHRRRGIGSAVLAAVEVLALRNGYRTVSLHPKSIDDELSNTQLIAWYEQNGFELVDASEHPTMTKRLNPPSHKR